jgi:hypothetical protein
LKEKMMKSFRSLALGFGLTLALVAPVFAQSLVTDQIPAPVPSASNTALNSEVYVQRYTISGGFLYQSCFRGPGSTGGGGAGGVPFDCSALTFVPTNLSGAFTRFLDLSAARLDSGLISTSATGTSTAFGIARTAGTSYDLIGAATSSSAVTTKALWEASVASTYVAGTAIPIVVNANYTGSGTITGASTTLTVTAYTEVGGVETAITGITAAQAFTGTAANYTFNIPTTAGLVAGQHIVVEVSMLVTTSSGANTGQINALGMTM